MHLATKSCPGLSRAPTSTRPNRPQIGQENCAIKSLAQYFGTTSVAKPTPAKTPKPPRTPNATAPAPHSTPVCPPAPPMLPRPAMKRVLRHPRTLAIGANALGAYLHFALRTTTWTLQGEQHLRPHIQGTPAILAFWHERLPLMPALWTFAINARTQASIPQGRAHVLVSRHQDGRLIGQMMRRFGLDLVHGSSAKNGAQKGGSASLRTLLALLAQGDPIAITPDGPRGPPHQAARGVAQLAALAQVPIIPCAAQTTRHRRLPTWDRMVLPLPYARGTLVCGPPINVPRTNWDETLPDIEAALNEAAQQADAACRA